MKKYISVLIAIALVAMILTGCTEAERVSQNISQRADNFDITRRLTVFNVRTDTILFQMTGLFSIQTDSDDGQLEVTCELDDGTYSKHFVRLSDETTYIVEDLSGADVSKYSYELNFLPKMVPGVKIISKD